MAFDRIRAHFPAFFAGLICLLVFLPALRCGFIVMDDTDYVLNNQLIRSLDFESISAMFTRSHLGWWMPLTWLSLALDYRIWGTNPFGYHLTNILLHAVNASLVVLIAGRVCRRNSVSPVQQEYVLWALLLFAGLFFGIHPLRVESVAWVSERKDVLNGFFSFASILFYFAFADAADDPERRRFRWWHYGASLLCFVLSLMAKSVSVVLPLMLLALDRFPLDRVRRETLLPVILEKVPFLAASALMAAGTLLFAFSSQYLVTYEAFPLVQRIYVSGNAIWEYCRMLLLPAGLSPFNVIPDPIPDAYRIKAVLVLIALPALFFSRTPVGVKSCLVCFLLPLLPVLAFFQNGDQSYADRFTYLPSLSVSLLVTYALHGTMASGVLQRWKRPVLLAAALVTVLLMIGTVRQIRVWRTTETYWTRIIAVEPLAISYKERGRYYHSIGRYDAAINDFTAALGNVTATLKPYEYNLYAFRAESLREAGRLAEALQDFTAAIDLQPHPVYYYHRGLTLRAMGRAPAAAEDFRRAGNYAGPIVWID